MKTVRNIQCILVVFLLVVTPATALFALAVGPEQYLTALDGPLALENLAPKARSRSMNTIVDTTLDDFLNGTRDRTLALDKLGGDLSMRTFMSLGAPITGDSAIFSMTEAQDGSIFAGGMTTGKMVKIDPVRNSWTAVNGSNQVVSGENFISALATGNDGTIWGGTGNGIIFRMDPGTEQVTVLNGGTSVDPNKMVIGLAVLSNGTIWGSTITPITFEIDPSTNAINIYGDFGGAIPGETRAIIADSNDDLWIGSTDGSDAWATQVNTSTYSSPWDGQAVVGDTVTKVLVEAPDGNIWGATEASGFSTLFQIDPSGPTVTNYGYANNISPDTTSMVMGPKSTIWAGTRFDAHIYEVDARSGMGVDHGSFFSSSHVAIRGMISSSDGTVWGGTQAQSGDAEIFRMNPVTDMTEPVMGETWISDMTEGIDGKVYGATQDDINLGRGSFMFSYDPGNDIVMVLNGGNPMITNDIIPALTTGLDGRIWGGTDPSAKVFSYNTSTQGTTFVNSSNPITGDPITDLETGTDGTIWGSTLGGQVFRIDPADGSTLVLNGGAPVITGGGLVYEITVATDGTIWGGEQAMGKVFSIDPGTNTITDQGQAVSGQNMVFAITEGSDGRIYGSTFEIGQSGHVFIFNTSNSTFTDLGNPLSVPGAPIITSLVPDGMGLVWGSTRGPGRLFSVQESDLNTKDGPSPVPAYTVVDNLFFDRNGDLWGMTQGDRFGGDITHMFQFRPRATYTSVGFDLGPVSDVKYLNWTETSFQGNTSVALRMRSAATDADLTTASWGQYNNITGNDPDVQPDRWVQYQASFLKFDVGIESSSLIEDVEIAFMEVPVMTAGMSVDKTVAKRGEEITYTLYFNNTGGVASANVLINDTLDPSLILLSSSDETNRTNSSWSYPTIGPGTFNNITVTARINSTATAGSVINNSFALSFTDPDGDNGLSLNSTTVSTVVEEIDLPVITVSKSVDLDTAFPGDELVYNITIDNDGPGTASNVTVTDVIDPRLDVIDIQGSINGSKPKLFLDDIISGEARVLTITVRANDSIDLDITIRNNATVNYTSTLGDPMPGSITNTVSTVIRGGPAPALVITKEVNETRAEPGDGLMYTIVINNTGNAEADTVTITDVLSSNLTLMNSSDETNRTGDTWTMHDLAAGSSIKLEILTDVNNNVLNGTIIPNSATVEYTNTTGTVIGVHTSNTVSTTVLTTYKPVMTLEKVVDRSLAAPGDELTYNIFFNNTGSAPAAWVAIDEVIPSQYVLFISSSHPYPTPYSWNFSNVGPGSHVLTISVLVKDDVPRDTYVKNQVLISYADSDGNYLGDLQAAVSTIVRGGEGADKTNPSVIGNYPFRGDILVSVDTRIEVIFSEPMDHSKAEAAFRIDPATTGNFTWDGSRMIFTPKKNLEHAVTYTVKVLITAEDLAGNPLANPHVWTFKTRAKEVVPDDQDSVTCYILTALVVGLALGALIFYIAHKRRFLEIEETEATTEKATEEKVETEGPKMEGGSPTEEETDIEELEEEAGSGPELALAEGEEEALEEPEPPTEHEDEVIDETPDDYMDETSPEGNVEDEEREEPPDREEEEGSEDKGSLDDLLEKLKQ